MQLIRRVMPWSLSFVLLVAFGCAQPTNQKVAALQRENATLRTQVDQLNIDLAAAKDKARGRSAELDQRLRRQIASLAIMSTYVNQTETAGQAAQGQTSGAVGSKVPAAKHLTRTKAKNWNSTNRWKRRHVDQSPPVRQ